MSIGGINGLLAYSGSLEEIRAISRQRPASGGAQRARADRGSDADGPTRPTPASSPGEPEPEATGPAGYSDAETRELERLKARDREVRAHEQAHKAAAGRYAQGGPNFSYTRGPDGRPYATAGSVSIDTSEVPGDPEATLAKMQQVRRAALAPAEPSSQDSRVAADAAQKANEVRREIPEASDDDSAQRVARGYQELDRGPDSGSRLDVRA